MRELLSGKTVLPVRGSNLARLFYAQEFGGEFDQTLKAAFDPSRPFREAGEDLLRIVWAMHRAELYYRRESVPAFTKWIVLLSARGFALEDCLADLMSEIEAGFMVRRTYSQGGDDDGERLAQKVIAVALRMGMTLDDLNELTTQALVDIMHEYVGERQNEPKRRKATPREATMYFLGR